MQDATPNHIQAHLPIIGIVPTSLPDVNKIELRGAYTDAIIAAGGVPVVLPLVADKAVYETLFPMMDGFLLTGGADISPERYYSNEHHAKADTPTPLREEIECLILSYAYKFDVPTLGICRGMQMMNVFFGGTLYQDLYDQFPLHDDDEPEQPIEHWQQDDWSHPSHFVRIIRDSKLGEMLDSDRLATNSMHHQGVKELSPMLKPAAYGPDGLVEAIEMPNRTFMMGVQWHPEYFARKNMKCIFSALINEAASARRSGRVTMDPLKLVRDDGSNRWSVCRYRRNA